MSYPTNPYASGPNAGMNPMNPMPSRRLADLGKRFLGALIDSLVGLIFVVPGYGMMIAGAAGSQNNNAPTALFFVGLAVILLGSLALLGVQIYLLATRSQSLGKVVMKTQIVDHTTGQPADFVHSFLLRALANGLIASIPCVGGVYAIVDICYIFSDDRRCLHDKLANTSVVDIA